ncbi:dolichyl-phosphate-mannose-protein mannosyltransferase [Bosea psychrotolerans]|uniref:Dolichyl-phosphate-mannose-protein mannosyltransferase n=1 Tax=Bosea psychrotolerans TaxID=1871628 RepID=A0A2S4LYC1_9HYPH|nr:dolichyl-phosphate-mannose-protein mannosyltransferase [Bosea psychrotolerans]
MSHGVTTQRINPAVVIVVLGLIGSSFLWVLRDTSVWPWDQAWYGEVALDLAQSRRGSGWEWLRASLAAFGSKPPLLAWVAQFFAPLSRWLGDVEPALLMVNVLAQLATLLLIARICARMGCGVLAQLAGVLAFGGSSLSLGLSHQFLTETLQMLSVAIMLDLIWKVERRAVASTILWGVLIMAFAMLVKASSFTFAIPFAAYCIVACVIRMDARQAARPVVVLLLALAAAVVCAACIGWYWVNWAPMTQHFRNATSNDIALAYGSVGTLGSKLSLWTQSLALALSPWPFVAVVIGAPIALAFAVSLANVVKAPRNQWPLLALDNGFLYAGALIGTIALTVLGLATQINEETRFLSPTLPMIAVLLGWALTVLRWRWLQLLALIAVACNAVYAVSFAHGYNPLGLQPSVWLKPVNLDADRKNLLARAVTESCSASRPNRYAIIGVEYPSFNGNSAAFFSAKQQRKTRYRCYYTSLGYAEADLDKALARIDSLDADYLITFTPDRQHDPDLFNRISSVVAERLSSDPRFTATQDRDSGLMIFHRRR